MDPSSNNTLNEGKDENENKHTTEYDLLDIAFILDCTGSMNQYIESCKDNINKISMEINKETNSKYDVQFGLVLYRDIPPQDHTFITKKIDFTSIPLQIQLELNKIKAKGGGDQPEALASALYDCYKNLKWRKKSIKVIVIITDAPPHGLEQKINDGFPNGDIDTFNTSNSTSIANPIAADQNEGINDKYNQKYLNIIEIIQSIRNDLNASIYGVACEPSLSCNNDFANDFMQYMSEYTDGKFLPLSSAKLLPSVIIGSVKQQINMDKLSDKLSDEIIQIKLKYGNNISNDKLNKLIQKKWKNDGIKKQEIIVDDIYSDCRSRENIELLLNEQLVKSLSDFKQKAKFISRMKRNNFIKTKNKTNVVNKLNIILNKRNILCCLIGTFFILFTYFWLMPSMSSSSVPEIYPHAYNIKLNAKDVSINAKMSLPKSKSQYGWLSYLVYGIIAMVGFVALLICLVYKCVLRSNAIAPNLKKSVFRKQYGPRMVGRNVSFSDVKRISAYSKRK